MANTRTASKTANSNFARKVGKPRHQFLSELKTEDRPGKRRRSAAGPAINPTGLVIFHKRGKKAEVDHRNRRYIVVLDPASGVYVSADGTVFNLKQPALGR